MKRYYSHFTFIYPDHYLKNHIIELDDNNHIIKVFPFEKEIASTSFFSGLLIFIPSNIRLSNDILASIKKEISEPSVDDKKTFLSQNEPHIIYNEDGNIVY